MSQALILASIWPEPTSSAAGVRTLRLGRALRDAGHAVAFGSPSPDNAFSRDLRDDGFSTHYVTPNDSDFDAWVRTLSPEIVVFDRFMLEEQFGWRVRAAAPEAMRVLDTIDLHFVRRARQAAVEDDRDVGSASYATEGAARELAAILRSDLSLLVSDWERDLLIREYGLPPEALALARIAMPQRPGDGLRFDERRGFSWIGNFRHAPNWDAVRWLALEGWPRIRARLPHADLRVYGSYPPREAAELHAPEQGFHFEGPAPTAAEALAPVRVNLAPSRFGAGVKGKILEGWQVGTPAVATPIAAEGMHESLSWGGEIAPCLPEAFAEAAVRLHEDRAAWERGRARGFAILSALYEESVVNPKLIADLKRAIADLGSRRERNWQARMLWLQQNRATEYFSRWIEAKAQLQGFLSQSNSRSSRAP